MLTKRKMFLKSMIFMLKYNDPAICQTFRACSEHKGYKVQSFFFDSWSASPSSLWGLVVCDKKKLQTEINNNPVIYNTIRFWREMHKRLGREDFFDSFIEKQRLCSRNVSQSV